MEGGWYHAPQASFQVYLTFPMSTRSKAEYAEHSSGTGSMCKYNNNIKLQVQIYNGCREVSMIDVKKKKNTFQRTGRFQQVFANMLVEMFKYLINKSKCVLKYVASIQWWTILF